MIQTNTDYTPKTITNTDKSMPSKVYESLFKLDPYDAIIMGISPYTQNVKNVQ